MHRSKKSTERYVRLLMSRRLLSSTKSIDGDLSKAAASKAVSDRGTVTAAMHCITAVVITGKYGAIHDQGSR